MEFRVQTTTAPYAVDGRLRESFWKTADRLGDFRVEAEIALPWSEVGGRPGPATM